MNQLRRPPVLSCYSATLVVTRLSVIHPSPVGSFFVEAARLRLANDVPASTIRHIGELLEHASVLS
jgi:hypothetical protein